MPLHAIHRGFFYTRYPKLHIHFHNSGVGGDRAKDALTRFDEDVAAYKPKYVTILLGMNDGGYRDFDKPTFDTYQQDMTTLLDKIDGLGATAIPMTPTMFDSRSKSMKGDNSEAPGRPTTTASSPFMEAGCTSRRKIAASVSWTCFRRSTT
ncbi:MAG: GDSL-type esterase/lipase family protein [Chthoniobacter sp.]